MKAKVSTITIKGQITIPLQIRNKLQLTAGSKLEFIMMDNSFIVIPINKSIKNLKGMLPKPQQSLTTSEMNEIVKGSYDRN